MNRWLFTLWSVAKDIAGRLDDRLALPLNDARTYEGLEFDSHSAVDDSPF